MAKNLKIKDLLKQYAVSFVFLISTQFAIAFPIYYELNLNESIKLKNGVTLIVTDMGISSFDSVLNRIAEAWVTIGLNEKFYNLKVGHESNDLIAEGFRIGIDYTLNFQKSVMNPRIILKKDVRLRVSDANETLTPIGSHVYPLFTPWNSGFRTQGWLAVCYNIYQIEGTLPLKAGRYHEGSDLGIWEGQLIRSVCDGIVKKSDDYPNLMEAEILYDKNGNKVGGNPFIIKDKDLPLLYVHTHLGGLSKVYHSGDTIRKGEILGYASARGSSGDWFHLHFGIFHLEQGVFINTYPYLKQWYDESMPHFSDFVSCFDVYKRPGKSVSEYEFVEQVMNNQVKPIHSFSNTISGVVHVREATAEYPFSGTDHIVFNQSAVLKAEVNLPEAIKGELWYGHTGISMVYLNGALIYSGENTNSYHAGKQPFQWDGIMLPCNYRKGENEVVVFIKQTNPYWSFSLRLRDNLGRPIQ
jgi:murein DD-endopeptidase MepM/ murein hydrolase activator NlpD